MIIKRWVVEHIVSQASRTLDELRIRNDKTETYTGPQHIGKAGDNVRLGGESRQRENEQDVLGRHGLVFQRIRDGRIRNYFL